MEAHKYEIMSLIKPLGSSEHAVAVTSHGWCPYKTTMKM